MIALVREALASARSQVAASSLTIAIVALMCGAVLLTTGRTVATEEAALDAIDAAGTRSIIVHSSDKWSLPASLLDQLATIDGVSSVTGFGPIHDVHNSKIPGSEPVPVRKAYGFLDDKRLTTLDTSVPNAALATSAAAESLGLRDGVGVVEQDDGTEYEIIGAIELPEHLGFMGRAVLVPSSADDSLAGLDIDDPLAMLVILTNTPGQVRVLSDIVSSYLVDADSNAISIETSEQLATIRQAVSGQLGTYGRTTVLGILAVCSIVIAVNLHALVVMRRKDFGRRRALGARRIIIISLLLIQVAITASVGAIIGCGGTLAVLAWIGSPFPGWAFSSAIAILAVLSALVATLSPAWYAASRDPLHELRVP